MLVRAKDNGDYQDFIKAHKLEEQQEYSFLKKDDSTTEEGESEERNKEEFDALGAFEEAIAQFREKQTSNKALLNNRYMHKKRSKPLILEQVFCSPQSVMDQDPGWTPPSFEKSEAERAHLKEQFATNMLTKRVAEEHLQTLINATQKREFKAGDTLIQFGDPGAEWFILDSGSVECTVYDEESKDEVFKKTITEGEAFGELALLYDAPRSATIVAASDCSCWVLDRTTFKSIIMASAV